MSLAENIPFDLYQTAMDLFIKAGHIATATPINVNHSPEQVIYFDSNIDTYLSRQQCGILKEIANISHLFDLSGETFDNHSDDTCGIYSIELISSFSSRSQVAYDAHITLIPFLPGTANIILFRHNNKLMLSMQGLGSDVILSDWYDEETEIDKLADLLDIVNVSLNSLNDYIGDVIYNCARWYYIHPISVEQATYDMFPLNFFSSANPEDFGFIKNDIKEYVRSSLLAAETEYGDDYVEHKTNNYVSMIDISAELDLLSLEIDMDEDSEENPFGEYSDVDDDDFDSTESDNEQIDEYEFDDYEEDVFLNPLVMLNLLKENDKRKNGTNLPAFLDGHHNESSLGTDLASFFREFDLEVIDKRSKGGCLWVVGDEETLKEYIMFAEKEFGVTGEFAVGKAIGGRIGWYTKSKK